MSFQNCQDFGVGDRGDESSQLFTDDDGAVVLQRVHIAHDFLQAGAHVLVDKRLIRFQSIWWDGQVVLLQAVWSKCIRKNVLRSQALLRIAYQDGKRMLRLE